MNLVSSSSALRWNSMFEGQKGSSEYSADPVTASWTLLMGASGKVEECWSTQCLSCAHVTLIGFSYLKFKFIFEALSTNL